MGLVHGVTSDVGLKRARNEDRFCIDPALGLYVICDGMGGHQAGEVASGMAVDVIQHHVLESGRNAEIPIVGCYDDTFLPQTNRLASAIRVANRMIHDEAGRQIDYARMGTTVVSALISGQILSFAHVGDSRLYLIRGGTIQLLTRDHSLVMEQIRDGLLTEEEAEHSTQRHVVTRALGIDPAVEVELGEVPIMDDDLLLLCSDGLTRGVKPDRILEAVHRARDLQAASDRLVTLANAAGGEDNTTVILIALRPSMPIRAWQRLRSVINSRLRRWN